ncbi:NuoM family protein [uncultured Thiothrix sp.]|uniref:complex I subunit 4 family protein n=1 Tax=uncultured Thiothrix sp. TaxID=223185 RepID=UPI002626EC9D|nr:NADH-quinone oxidoreductase subunit M [uncultured Thiothrix sp.]HMT91670.1 NADH-quinone oxidoreductase subunit M [Thiolinea sp.]
MIDFLIFLLLMPVTGALFILFLPNHRQTWIRPAALSTAVLTLIYTLYLATQMDFSNPAVQLVAEYQWNERLGTYFSFGVDGLSYPLVALTNLLMLVAIAVSTQINERIKGYYILLLLLEAATMGVFLTQGWALFYVFWELVLIPLFFLIDRWGGANRQRAALNFVLYTMGGSVFMLLGLLMLFDANPEHRFLFASIKRASEVIPPETQTVIFLGLMIGLGVKMPLFPLHGWLPLAHVEAPSPVSILLSGILLKMGAYGLIRSAEMLPAAALNLQDLMMALGMIGMLYGGLLAWRQSDLKKMIAYSSVSHMGVVMIGIAALNENGLMGAAYQMVAHGLVAGALFMLIGLLYERTHTRDINDYGSLLRATPRFAVLIILALVGGVGLPGTAGFIGELHALIGGFERWGWLVAALSLGMLITATYSLRTVKQLYTGPINLSMQQVEDLKPLELVAGGVLVTGTLLLGFYPLPLLDVLLSSLQAIAAPFGA